MGVRGAVIMSFFGAIFFALTLAWQWQISGVTLAFPFIVFALIASAGLYAIRHGADGGGLSRKVRKAILWSSTAEGIGIFVAVNVLTNLHRPELRLPATALIVGLHFLPIAAAAATRRFYILGAVLIGIAAVGFVLSPPAGGEVAGIASAICLWIAAVFAIARDRHAGQLAAIHI